jgi:hypothetical protein
MPTDPKSPGARTSEKAGGVIRETDMSAHVLMRDLADHFKPLREHLVDRADGEGIELFWDAIERVRGEVFGPGR